MNDVLPVADASDAVRVGGKAHGLRQLVSWGFDVPDAYVITADAYGRAISAESISGLISDQAAFSAIRAAIQSAQLDDQLRSGLADAWSALQAESDGLLAVACRSSAIGEDSSTASFAGQHDTILGITSLEWLEHAVRQCWASIWTDQAAAYRQRTGIPAPAMAVVVQRMARADVSGVAFSVNPVTGDPSQVVINSSYGLGELIVSGAITPDTFVIDRESGAVLASEISPDKGRMLVLNDDGTVEERPVQPVLAASASLDEPKVGEVSAAVLRAERMAGTPQDVEWVFEGDRLLLLQSRPVTTLGS